MFVSFNQNDNSFWGHFESELELSLKGVYTPPSLYDRLVNCCYKIIKKKSVRF